MKKKLKKIPVQQVAGCLSCQYNILSQKKIKMFIGRYIFFHPQPPALYQDRCYFDLDDATYVIMISYTRSPLRAHK